VDWDYTEWTEEEKAALPQREAARLVCEHVNVETENYLNPCSMAACKLSGVHTYHLGCGSQERVFCSDCGAKLQDSADDMIEDAEWDEQEYICRQCEVEGIQSGHTYCGQTFLVPAN